MLAIKIFPNKIIAQSESNDQLTPGEANWNEAMVYGIYSVSSELIVYTQKMIVYIADIIYFADGIHSVSGFKRKVCAVSNNSWFNTGFH